jgi:hypothetical protein
VSASSVSRRNTTSRRLPSLRAVRHQDSSDQGGLQPPTVNSSAVVLRFLSTVTLGCTRRAAQLARVRYLRRLPRVLSPRVLVDCSRSHLARRACQATLSVGYGAALPHKTT